MTTPLDILDRLKRGHAGSGVGPLECKEAINLIERLKEAMAWMPAALSNIDLDAYYLVKDNGGEWRDFDLHVMHGRMVAHRLNPDYVRGRPQWVAKITRPATEQETQHVEG